MQKNQFKKLNNEQLAYLAGFVEADGCFLVQIIPGLQYRYKHTIRISIVFYQKKDKH
jgi:intein/homing endonuclease